jgi:hypothetical protein
MLVVIEGKRTERKATTVTTWMRSRSQMLRHMDAAVDISQGKRVLGMMIVEGPGGADAVTPNGHWLTSADSELLENTLADSLPHSSNDVATGVLSIRTRLAAVPR